MITNNYLPPSQDDDYLSGFVDDYDSLSANYLLEESNRFRQGQEREYNTWKDARDSLLAEKNNLYKANMDIAERKRKEAALKNLVGAFGNIADMFTIARGGTVPARDFRNDVGQPLEQADTNEQHERATEYKAYQHWLDKFAELQGRMPKTTSDKSRLELAKQFYNRKTNNDKLKNAFDSNEARIKAAAEEKEKDRQNKLDVENIRQKGINSRAFIRVNNYGSGKEYNYQTEKDGLVYTMPLSQANHLIEMIKRDIDSGEIPIPTKEVKRGRATVKVPNEKSLEYQLINNRNLSNSAKDGILSMYWHKYFDVNPSTGGFVLKNRETEQQDTVAQTTQQATYNTSGSPTAINQDFNSEFIGDPKPAQTILPIGNENNEGNKKDFSQLFF